MKFLIVDDDSFKIDGIKDTLKSLGYNNFSTAGSRSEMVGLLREQQFDVVILDNNFPLYNASHIERDLGIDILRMIEATITWDRLFKNSKVILCSSDDIEEIFDCDNYLGNIVYDSSVDMTESFSELLDF